MRGVLIALAPLLMAQAAPGPRVPEGVHSLAKGPETICGITGASALDFERLVKASPKAEYNNETDRYVTYVGPMDLTLWAFAKPSNFAYPVATCVRVFEQDGKVFMDRKMRCDANRENCDRAYLEFHELDATNRAKIQSREKG